MTNVSRHWLTEYAESIEGADLTVKVEEGSLTTWFMILTPAEECLFESKDSIQIERWLDGFLRGFHHPKGEV